MPNYGITTYQQLHVERVRNSSVRIKLSNTTDAQQELPACLYTHIYVRYIFFCFFILSDTLFSLVALGHTSSTANDVADTFHSRWHPCKAIRTFSPHGALISEAAHSLFCR